MPKLAPAVMAVRTVHQEEIVMTIAKGMMVRRKAQRRASLGRGLLVWDVVQQGSKQLSAVQLRVSSSLELREAAFEERERSCRNPSNTLVDLVDHEAYTSRNRRPQPLTTF